MANSLRDVSIAILHRHYREHSIKAQQAQELAVYIDLTPGRDEIPQAEGVVESAMRDANIAEALYHAQQAKRFGRALINLDDSLASLIDQSYGHDETVCSRGSVMCEECNSAGGE